MKIQRKSILMLSAIIGTLSLMSCREIKEEETVPPMQNEMHQENMDHDMEGDDAMMDDHNMDATTPAQ